jgi:hypothetical protein
MRALALALAALSLAACGANPLLGTLASDYAPIRVGSQWSYRSPDGSTTLVRAVSAAGPYQGLQAFTVDSSLNGAAPTQSHLAFRDGDLLQHSASLGWILSRRLPLVTGNRWDVPSGSALISTVVIVDGIERVVVPAGNFAAAFRLRTRSEVYDSGSGVTSTVESLAWAAPDVGDVRYATVASDGTVTTTLELVGATIP